VSPDFSWQRATPVIVRVGWLAGPAWKNNISGLPNRLNYFIKVHTQFTNMAAGREMETHML